MRLFLSLTVVSALTKTAAAFVSPPPSSSRADIATVAHQIHRLDARKSKSSESEPLDAESSSSANNPAKRAALDGVLQRIERNYGRGSIVKLGDADRMTVDCVSSGSLTLGER